MGLSCKPNIYVSWSTSELRVRLAPLNRFKPSSKIFYWAFQGGTSLWIFYVLFCLVFAMFCARLFICALWSPAGKGLTFWLSFVVSTVSLSLSHWYPWSGVVLIASIPDLCTLTYFAYFPSYKEAVNVKYKMKRSTCKSPYICDLIRIFRPVHF